MFYSQEIDRIASSPEQPENLVRIGAANGVMADAAKLPTAEMKKLQEQSFIATGKFILTDQKRSPYPMNQNLRNSNWVKAFKNQLEEKADLQNPMSGTPEIVGKTFALNKLVSEMADNALGKMVQE